MRRIQIDTTVVYADEVDVIIEQLAELRDMMTRRDKPKTKKKKQSKRDALRTKEQLSWSDIFKILRRHHETDAITARRTSNLLSMMAMLARSKGLGFEVRCNSCESFVSTPEKTADHSVGCPGRSDGTTKILYVLRKSVLANYEKIGDVSVDYYTAVGRRQDLVLLAGFLEGKVK